MTRDERLKEVTLLYVEDDDLIRKHTARCLRRRCKNLIEARNGKEGLEAYRQNKACVVITDIEMPVMDGMEMIEKITTLNAKQPIIITTGYNDKEHKSKKAFKNMVKPIILNELIEAICSALESSEKENSTP